MEVLESWRMEVVVEMEEMETVAHDLTRLVVEGRPGTQARSPAGLDAFFASSALHRHSSAEILVLGPDAFHLSETAFFVPRNRPSAPNRFASRHLYQFQERSCCPPLPSGRYAAGYRGAKRLTSSLQ